MIGHENPACEDHCYLLLLAGEGCENPRVLPQAVRPGRADSTWPVGAQMAAFTAGEYGVVRPKTYGWFARGTIPRCDFSTPMAYLTPSGQVSAQDV